MIYLSNAEQVMREARKQHAEQGTALSISDAAVKGDNWLTSVLQNAKQTALTNQQEQRERILSRVEGLSNPLDADAMQSVKEVLNTSGVSSTYSSVQPSRNSAKTVKKSSKKVKPIDYLNADLAKHYGMDARSAYSEALQNTAYQRAVADLKAAGLNPVLAAGAVSPAGSFAAGDTLSYGSGSGSSGRVTGGKSGKYAFSEDEYNLLGVIGTVVGGVLGYAASPAPWKLMGAGTGASLGKSLLQSGAQGIDSIKKIFD